MKSNSTRVNKKYRFYILRTTFLAVAVFIGVTTALVMYPREDNTPRCPGIAIEINGAVASNNNCSPIQNAGPYPSDINGSNSIICSGLSEFHFIEQHRGWPMEVYATGNPCIPNNVSLLNLFVAAIPGFILGTLILLYVTYKLRIKYEYVGGSSRNIKDTKKSSRK